MTDQRHSDTEHQRVIGLMESRKDRWLLDLPKEVLRTLGDHLAAENWQAILRYKKACARLATQPTTLAAVRAIDTLTSWAEGVAAARLDHPDLSVEQMARIARNIARWDDVQEGIDEKERNANQIAINMATVSGLIRSGFSSMSTSATDPERVKAIHMAASWKVRPSTMSDDVWNRMSGPEREAIGGETRGAGIADDPMKMLMAVEVGIRGPGDREIIAVGTPALEVEETLEEWGRAFSKGAWSGIGSPHPLIRAALAHASLEMIHPFEDGNSRTGRAVMVGIQIESGLQSAPISSAIEANRDGYRKALADLMISENVEAYVANHIALNVDAVERSLRLHAEIRTQITDLVGAMRAEGKGEHASEAMAHELIAHPVLTLRDLQHLSHEREEPVERTCRLLQRRGLLKVIEAADGPILVNERAIAEVERLYGADRPDVRRNDGQKSQARSGPEER